MGVGLGGHFEGGFGRLYLSELTGFTFAAGRWARSAGWIRSLADPFAAIRYETWTL